MASPAVQLFVDRATSADPGFRLSAESLPAVVEICRRLDGLPLALELAAARVRSMAPADVASGLDERFTLLTSGSPTDTRHQTLLATVEWSYEMLEPADQVLFDRLSVFAGSFTADDVEQVCADPVPGGSGAAAVPTLVDKSMVTADTSASPTRYSLLETLREFGRATPRRRRPHRRAATAPRGPRHRPRRSGGASDSTDPTRRTGSGSWTRRSTISASRTDGRSPRETSMARPGWSSARASSRSVGCTTSSSPGPRPRWPRPAPSPTRSLRW